MLAVFSKTGILSRYGVALLWPLVAVALTLGCSTEPPAVKSRTFEFHYQALFPSIPKGGEQYRIWVPLPSEGSAQQIHDLKVVSPVGYKQREESVFGNRYAYIEFDRGDYPWPLSVTVGFQVTRQEHKVYFDSASFSSNGTSAGAESGARAGTSAGTDYAADSYEKFLQPNRLVPLDGIIGDLSKQYTAGAASPLEKARKVYDYVVSTMAYDKSGDGWGRGDALYACDVKKGNCTDFHALFIGMMRAAGIPARFEIGFPLPPNEKRGSVPGYHCWASFHVDGIGWIPVDASEAWKDPARKDYFFGALDEHRVQFTTGRDIRLDAGQAGAPLNYFIYPYAELDGQPVEPIEKRFLFRDLANPS
jgi:transglutaminase-like putative cysteine protease